MTKFTNESCLKNYIKIKLIKLQGKVMRNGELAMYDVQESHEVREEGSFKRGLAFGIFLSIPLWISMVGWLQLLTF